MSWAFLSSYWTKIALLCWRSGWFRGRTYVKTPVEMRWPRPLPYSKLYQNFSPFLDNLRFNTSPRAAVMECSLFRANGPHKVEKTKKGKIEKQMEMSEK